MAKTKIVVIQLKEIIYTVIFAALGILLILLLISMFTNKDKDLTTSNANLYKAGVWTSAFELYDTAINLEVVTDQNHINNVRLVNIDEAITTMYPLINPSLEAITTQLYNDVPVEQVTLLKDSQYTQQLLLDAIKLALSKAQVTTTNVVE